MPPRKKADAPEIAPTAAWTRPHVRLSATENVNTGGPTKSVRSSLISLSRADRRWKEKHPTRPIERKARTLTRGLAATKFLAAPCALRRPCTKHGCATLETHGHDRRG